MGRRPLPKWIAPLLHGPLTPWRTWGISSSFPELSPASGQVTYVLLTRSPLGHLRTNTKGLVRLACIRHAASVHPEPGSNSPQKLSHNEVGFDYEVLSQRFVLLFWLSITIQLLRFEALILRAG